MLVEARGIDFDALVAGMAAMEPDLFGRGAWSQAMVRQELSAPARDYVVDLVGDGAAGMDGDRMLDMRGYAGFWFDGDDAQIMTVAVREDARRQGIASAMMAWMIERARGLGARRMLLEVRVDNAAALSLYHRFGFVRLGVRKRYYQPEGVDAYTMELEVGHVHRGGALASAGADADDLMDGGACSSGVRRRHDDVQCGGV